jgi:hypothetical protein
MNHRIHWRYARQIETTQISAQRPSKTNPMNHQKDRHEEVKMEALRSLWLKRRSLLTVVSSMRIFSFPIWRLFRLRGDPL